MRNVNSNPEQNSNDNSNLMLLTLERALQILSEENLGHQEQSMQGRNTLTPSPIYNPIVCLEKINSNNQQPYWIIHRYSDHIHSVFSGYMTIPITTPSGDGSHTSCSIPIDYENPVQSIRLISPCGDGRILTTIVRSLDRIIEILRKEQVHEEIIGDQGDYISEL